MTKILYAGNADDWDEYRIQMQAALRNAGLNMLISNQCDDPEAVEYILYAPNGPIQDLTPFKNLKLVQSLWAGVEVALANETITQPLARMVDIGMSIGMSDYVMGQILRHHLRTDKFSHAEIGDWDMSPPPLSIDRTVAFLGLGALGTYCAQKVADYGFRTIGWSRSLKSIDTIASFSGDDGLQTVLEQADIIVLLLPNTPHTTNIINADLIARMKDGVAIINPGRGPLIDDDALLAALDSGKVSSATLDVFHTEPLPVDHRYWTHPNVLVTPHVASSTRIDSASKIVVENIRRGEHGEAFLHLVDRSAGY
ncbi:glyoxylate/hydroxypyruvate reductase A [Amylibacter ulvae]|uniref:Glyoxylate/hydroxypyruvate reductase A n=1 Tax=Paramylibacter ulvae TaxID=1651968 RepID=A0ABQ3CZ77_9RHOB|nr:glyoxylate/hydroxypyruvate reductase A [Amylibacter ulvae]GHA45626.1 glyoxylate/hydroxypyruvate reductase A [Amylibacter ulvae]